MCDPSIERHNEINVTSLAEFPCLENFKQIAITTCITYNELDSVKANFTTSSFIIADTTY